MDSENSSVQKEGATTPPPRLAEDDLYHALADRTRRRTLAYLLENPESSVEELADALSGWTVAEGEMIRPDRHDRVHTRLVHNHLPRLAETDLVAYDREAGTVAVDDIEQPVGELIHRSILAERTR